jgi:hypothetical protein
LGIDRPNPFGPRLAQPFWAESDLVS